MRPDAPRIPSGPADAVIYSADVADWLCVGALQASSGHHVDGASGRWPPPRMRAGAGRSRADAEIREPSASRDVGPWQTGPAPEKRCERSRPRVGEEGGRDDNDNRRVG